MATLPIPVDRYLVPAQAAAPSDDFTRVRQSLDAGLPARIKLDGELTLVLFVPTGDAARFRDAPSDAAIADASEEQAPRPVATFEDPAARAPARLVLRRAGVNLAALPLAAGIRRRLPDDGSDVGALVEVWIIDFVLCAGSMRESGTFGSYIDFAWRRCDAGASRFLLPPLDPRVAARFTGVIESQVGETDPRGAT